MHECPTKRYIQLLETLLDLGCKSIPTGAQYVAVDSKYQLRKSQPSRFSSVKWFQHRILAQDTRQANGTEKDNTCY
jgi:hypothetical protein